MGNSFDHIDLFEQSDIPCLLTTKSGCIRYANPALEKLTQYPRGEILGCNPRLFRSGKTPEDIYIDLWTTISSGDCWRGELLNRKKSGEQYWEYITISPVVDKEQATVGYLGLVEDRTEQIRKQRERERLLDTVRNFLEETREDRLLPICSNCHSIRHANNEWEDLTPFLEKLLGKRCTHGICPGCVHKLYPELAQAILANIPKENS